MTKECRWRDHEGKRRLPIERFSTNRRRSDGRHPYCKECAKNQTYAFREKKRAITLIQRAARAAVAPQPIPLLPEQRVLFALEDGPKTQKQISRKARVYNEQLGLALVNLILVDKKVISRVNGDERFYFLKSEAA